MYNETPVSELLGNILTLVTKTGNEEITFVTREGETYKMYHQQDCCESVYIESVVGDLENLIGSPITMADESSSSDRPSDVPETEYAGESQTWTFYKFATVKGYVDIRWLGESNGYYSEGVSFERTSGEVTNV